MFNTKRIQELEEEVKTLTKNLTITVDGANKAIEKFNDKKLLDIIPCSTCKCLIRKEDAVKGKSEVVRKDMAISESCGDKKYGTFIEELVTPYYCHSKDCKPKK